MTALAVLPPGADDTQLVRRAREGDLSAFEALVSRYRDQVVRVATRIVGRDEAEDVAQDALLRAFHSLPSFRGEAPFRSWLLRIVHNMSIDARNRRTPIPIDVDDGVSADVPDSPRPASMLEQHERSDRMALKIRELKPEHRAVLVLRDLEGMAYDDIARITETPIGSVKGRLHRARKELIEALRNNTYDWELPR
ncbi:MAG: sigma-70 family RNA polymerase sigma factor [Actinobacteria bacterium]|nr:sigma-70 family RNA polymerase sigma factor [Thermoleophilia bacterium]MCB9012288.1 sigma-70 family RNA polymerase sigma factor [Actinomycetota bacterium]